MYGRAKPSGPTVRHRPSTSRIERPQKGFGGAIRSTPMEPHSVWRDGSGKPPVTRGAEFREAHLAEMPETVMCIPKVSTKI